jgi:hypothetical protein
MVTSKRLTIPERIKEFRALFEASTVELLLLALFIVGLCKFARWLLL